MNGKIIGLYDKEAWNNWMHEMELLDERNEGIAEGKEEVAINLLNADISDEIIKKTTGFSLAKIQELKNKLLTNK